MNIVKINDLKYGTESENFVMPILNNRFNSIKGVSPINSLISLTIFILINFNLLFTLHFT